MMKTCTKCHKEYPATAEYFCKNSKNIDGLHNWCKNCQKEYDLNRSKNKNKLLQEQDLASKQIKICTKCNKALPFSAFNSDRNKKYGLSSICKECDKANSKRYREQNPNCYVDYYNEKHREEREIKAKIQADLDARGVKICTKCGKELPKSSFGYGGSEKAGSNWCNNCYKAYKTVYQESIKDRKREYDKIYNATHKEQRKAYKLANADKIKQYEIDNADKIQAYNKQRYENNKLGKLFSNAICRSLKGAKSERHWEDLVPYNLEQLKAHIEAQFIPPMSWDNYGTYWEVDHIIPQNLFNFSSSEDHDFQVCWSLTNLRPLEKSLNRSRPKDGSDISDDLKYKILNQ